MARVKNIKIKYRPNDSIKNNNHDCVVECVNVFWNADKEEIKYTIWDLFADTYFEKTQEELEKAL